MNNAEKITSEFCVPVFMQNRQNEDLLSTILYNAEFAGKLYSMSFARLLGVEKI